MHFNIKRFGLLFMKHTVEHYRYYLMAWGVLLGIIALLMGFIIYAEEGGLSVKGQAVIFALVLIGAGSIFTSTVFSDLGDKKKAIAALTLPASHLEKYLVGWLFSYLFFQIVYVASFYLVAYLMVPLDDWGDQKPQFMPLFTNENGQITFFVLFAFIHGIAFLGSIFFEKWHFIKTAFIYFLLMIGFMLLNRVFMESLLGIELESAVPFSNISLKEGEYYYSVRFPDNWAAWLAVVPLGCALLLWVTTYFRLREKEV
ncbi:hypothetical protein [Rufibacter roseus]|uniref:ABC transporter permease n=1 Tax=Rufibacter roseus TaxID=1567108 RepID=A0ABW2DNR6_9BACT|nr:hypothetical protein [Rufibacter roseus]